MGQQEIAQLLREHYPTYLSYLEIIEKLQLQKRAVLRCLSKLQKRNEIEFIIIECDKPSHGWIKKYRSK